MDRSGQSCARTGETAGSWHVIHYLLDALRIVELDLSSWMQCISLLVLPFASEDLAYVIDSEAD